MKNTLLYYYNLNASSIHQKDDIYYFKIHDENYIMYPVFRNNNEIKELFEINRELINKNIYVNEIILNNQNNILTPFNNTNYILMRILIKDNRLISADDIIYLENNTPVIKNNSILSRTNWVELWTQKNDYLEYQVSQFGINYPIIVEHFAYYIGLAENAIAYAKNTGIDVMPNHMDIPVICHKRISSNTNIFDFYNPMEFIIDYKVRDVAEYIKYKFFYNKENLWDDIHKYFNENNLSIYGVRMFYARLLYPTYYFDKYDEILDGITDEKDLINIINMQEEYEEFLADIYNFIKLKYNIPAIDWIMKK